MNTAIKYPKAKNIMGKYLFSYSLFLDLEMDT